MNRRGFIGAITAGLASIAAQNTRGTQRVLLIDGDRMFGVHIEYLPSMKLGEFKARYLSPAMAALGSRIAEIDRRSYRFVALELPKSSVKSWIEEHGGIPFRHIEAWDLTRPDEFPGGVLIHRIDVLARPV